MGTYLTTGVVENICFRKKDIHEKITIDNIKTTLQKDVNLDNYLYQEDETDVSWTIKPALLEGNFPDFLEKQFALYQLDGDKKDFDGILTEIKQHSSGNELLKFLEEKTFPNLQKIKHIFETITVRGNDGWERNIPVNYHLLAFFVDGKIIMECYGQILRYLEQNVRASNKEFPVAQCLKIMITS